MANTDNPLFILNYFIELSDSLAFEEAPFNFVSLGFLDAFGFFVSSNCRFICLLAS